MIEVRTNAEHALHNDFVSLLVLHELPLPEVRAIRLRHSLTLQVPDLCHSVPFSSNSFTVPFRGISPFLIRPSCALTALSNPAISMTLSPAGPVSAAAKRRSPERSPRGTPAPAAASARRTAARTGAAGESKLALNHGGRIGGGLGSLCGEKTFI